MEALCREETLVLLSFFVTFPRNMCLLPVVMGSSVREGTFFLGGEGGGGGSPVKVSSKRGGSYLFVSYSRESHTLFPEFFNEDFCDVAFHFPYRLSFAFHLL